MTTPNEANEAATWAAAQRPKATAQGPTDPAMHEADIRQVLAQDSKAARILAEAEAAARKAAAQADVKTREAAAQEDIRDREASRKARLKAEAEAAQDKKAAREQAKADNKAAARAEARSKAMALGRSTIDRIRGEAAASYAAFIYGVVLLVAIGSQFVFFKRVIDGADSLMALHSVSGGAAVLAALFIEGFGLAFYATSVASRLRGRGGWVPRMAAWAVTGFAAKMQYEAHRDLLFLDKPLVSYACAAASLGAMLLAEVRTTYKVGETLEKLDQKDKPQARLGIKFIARYPRQAWWAFSAMIASPHLRTRSAALRAGRLMMHQFDRANLNKALQREALRALKAAQKKKGTSEAILFRLNEFAYLGLDGLAQQAALASAALAQPAAQEASAQEVAQTDEANRPSRIKAAAQGDEAAVRPKAQGPAQTRPKAGPDRNPAKPSLEQWAEEAWAERPNGPKAWAQRVAELAQVFPNELPARAEVIETMKLRALDPELPGLLYSWTNKGYVGWAMADLKALRAENYPDPKLDPSMARTRA